MWPTGSLEELNWIGQASICIRVRGKEVTTQSNFQNIGLNGASRSNSLLFFFLNDNGNYIEKGKNTKPQAKKKKKKK